MSSEKIRGIIIRENFSGESDKFLTIFAKDIGKISVYAKGARNTKSKFLASSSLFTYADFLVRTATRTPTLLSADVIESFYNIRTDFDATAFASYFVELIDKTIIENIVDNDALLLLLKSLQRLAKSENPRLIAIIFQLRLLEILGYRPNIGEITDYKLSETGIYAIEYILSAQLNSVFLIKLNTEYIYEIELFLEKYIEYHIDINFKSYKIIKNTILN